MRPTGKVAAHAPVRPVTVTTQLMPPGEDITVPPPVMPDVSVNTGPGRRSKAALALRVPAMVSSHELPLQAPPHVLKLELPLAVVVSVTLLSRGKSAKQAPVAVLPVMVQSMPAGEDTTLPLPVPLAVSVRVA